MAFSSVRENVNPQHQVGNVLENVIIYKLFYLFNFNSFYFYFVLFYYYNCCSYYFKMLCLVL